MANMGNRGRPKKQTTEKNELVGSTVDSNKIKFEFIDQDKKYDIRYATTGSAGIDLKIINYHGNDNFIDINSGCQKMYGTGVKVEIPKGYVGLLLGRSSLTSKYGLSVANNVGVIDSDYRGEIRVILSNTTNKRQFIKPEDMEYHVQLLVVPIYQPSIEIDTVDDTNRSDGGFGSTG